MLLSLHVRRFAFVLLVASPACGGAKAPPPATAETAPATTAEPDKSPEPAAKGETKGDAAKTGLTEEKLHAAKALEEPFPSIEAVTKEIGAPYAQGKAPRRQWWFDKQGTGKSLHCSTLDLIKGPTGKAAFDDSVYTSPECKKATATSKQIVEFLNGLGGGQATDVRGAAEALTIPGKPFDEVASAMEKKLGKPMGAEEPAFAAWKYTNESSECRVLFMTSHVGSGASQVLWGLPCE
jgi:hypothetical protein